MGCVRVLPVGLVAELAVVGIFGIVVVKRSLDLHGKENIVNENNQELILNIIVLHGNNAIV